MEIKKYDLMWKDNKIGTFYEEFDRKRSFRIELTDEVLAEIIGKDIGYCHPYSKLKLRLNPEGFIDDEGVRLFISFRVMPKNRMNCDEILREMGLSEYDQFAIFKKNNGACTKDDLWVNFHNVTYESFHPRVLRCPS